MARRWFRVGLLLSAFSAVGLVESVILLMMMNETERAHMESSEIARVAASTAGLALGVATMFIAVFRGHESATTKGGFWSASLFAAVGVIGILASLALLFSGYHDQILVLMSAAVASVFALAGIYYLPKMEMADVPARHA